MCVAIAAALMVTAGSARAAGVDPGAATAVQRDQAQARFARGKVLYGNGSYAAALTEFRAATEIVASPNARLYVARCLRELNSLVEAYVEFERTDIEAREHAHEDTRYARTATTAAEEREELKPRLGFVTIHVLSPSDDTSLRIAGEEVRRAAWAEPAPVMPGVTEVLVASPGTPPARLLVTVAAGERKAVDIEAHPAAQTMAIPADVPSAPASAAPDRRMLRPLAFAALGLGAAGAATFGIAGALSSSAYSDLKASCPNNSCPAAKSNELSTGKTEQALANTGLAVGIVGLVAGTTLLIVARSPNSTAGAGRTPTAQTPARSGGAELVVSPSWAGVRGTF